LSPCKKECKLGANKLCLACHRTLKEIGDWGNMTNNNRMETMKKIKGEISTHNCPKCDKPSYCAMEDGKSLSACWCVYVPYQPIDKFRDGCLCRECLLIKEVK